jgi:hypothetical protein
MYQAIIGYCKNNDQLVSYCIKLLRERGMDEWFNNVFNEIIKMERNIKEDEIK